MKTTLLAGLVGIALAPAAFAHGLWLNVPPVTDGATLNIELGYGEIFPHGEPIPAKRQHIFAPIELLGDAERRYSFPIASEAYQFTASEVPAGSWLAIATYKPTRWSVKEENGKNRWQQAGKQQWPEAFCMENTMYAKTVSFVGAPGKNAAITRPTSVRLEFVPEVDPSTLKTGDTLNVKLLANGQPLKNHQVGIAYNDPSAPVKKSAGHAHHHDHGDTSKFAHPSLAHTYAYEAASMKDVTDANGVLALPILNKGQWVLMTAHDTPYEDKAACDLHVDETTFGFTITR
ncbi:DUF4198 domain-containing protein [Siccibacter colletis]|uniref:DUF4198 domain-containing protein n=1 Tax=Siccibacter colletis TaxID=1505757 RepID=UPI0004E0B2A9|nr:DUF4198 domain-containing protein [Siccibacter colletis]